MSNFMPIVPEPDGARQALENYLEWERITLRRIDLLRSQLAWLRDHPYAAGTEGEGDRIGDEIDRLVDQLADW